MIEDLRKRARRLDSGPVWTVVAVVTALIARVARTPRWYMRAGYAQEKRGRPERARSAYGRAVGMAGALPDWSLRLGGLQESAGDLAVARTTYRSAIRAHSSHSGAYERLASTFELEEDWQGVVACLREAVEAGADTPKIFEQLGLAYERLGARSAALRAYEGALDGPSDPGPAVGRRLASLLAEVGQWDRARSVLEANLVRHPRDLRSHRSLAEIAYRSWRWNGYFEGELDDLGGMRFRSLTELSDDLRCRDETLRIACQGMEHAALGQLSSSARVFLGDLRWEAGYLAGALAAYERSVSDAETSTGRWVFKALHRRQFRLERAHHAAGNARVDDPLFDSRIEFGGDEVPVGEKPAGLFDASLGFSGLRVEGFLTNRGVPAVEILLDGTVVRTLNVDEEPFFPEFSIIIRRPALELFPPKAELTMRTVSGATLVAAGRAKGYALAFPRSTGEFLAIIEAGGKLDKKGVISPSEEETRTRQDGYLELYDRVRAFFDEQIGTPLFVVYGTLLGLVRDGDFIPGDDDFDAAYISRETDPLAVKEETKQIVLRMVQAGFTVSFNRRGKLFRAQHPDVGGVDLHLDLRPMFFDEGRVWVHNFASFPCGIDDFLPVGTEQLRGHDVYVPRRPEVFLMGHYGPGWKVPDPSFTYHASEIDPAITDKLDKLLITPREYREMQDYLSSPEGRRPKMGRLVSVGSEPLYPLDNFVT
jgi:tetratricopeptide (TPR) repeat protein